MWKNQKVKNIHYYSAKLALIQTLFIQSQINTELKSGVKLKGGEISLKGLEQHKNKERN